MSATCSIFLLFTLIAISYVDEAACTVASFYGDSYIRWPMENANSETDIKLHFRTHQSEGLLLLAAGSPDYCVVELRMGMVRVRTDLGTGEAALSSPPGIRFDDWKWHNLHLSRKQENLRLTIDGIYTTSSKTPGRFFELNINSGIFLGGVGSFTDIFFGNLGSYRGCLKHVQFNDLDVVHGARQPDPLNIYGVTWDCSAEFGATSDQAISYLHNTSFMALPTLPARREGRISFDIRTRAEDALLIYNSGRLHSSDFFAVEMLRGNIKLTVNKGDGAVELMSVDRINDGLWHQIEVVVELDGARVTVDGVKEETYQSGTNRFLDLQGYLYVGGVSLQARGQAIGKGLRSLSGTYGPAGSLIGCLQNMKVNGVLQGFNEAEVTRGLTAECVWTYPCLSNPCIHDAICIEEGFYTYRCVCDQAECRKSTLTEANLPPVPINDVLAIQDVVVREGGRTLITIQNIDILFDYHGLGIRESSVVFRVVNPPEQGEVQVNIGRHEQQQTFTLLDMQSGKVTYLHHGSEVPVDSVGLEMEFFPSSSNLSSLPQKLRQKYGFTLIIKVAPWNDKPQILLPPDDTLIMVQNTDVRISSKLFNVLDKDDEAQNLEYTVEYPKLFDTGYFEISDSLGVRARIVSFTQEDVNEGRLKYVHRGSLQADIKLQVSDGKDISEARILHIRGVPLELRPVANHGIVITPGGGALIFRDNLTFATNVPNQDIDIRYEIIEPPFNGEVQRMQYADNQWITVTTFSQRHIDKSRLRYIHSYPSHHTTDYFKFRVTALNERTEMFNFTIRIIPSKVGIVNNKMMHLRGVRVERLTRSNILSNSSIPTHGQKVIKYSLVSLPQHGNLYKLDSNRGSRLRKHKLTIGGNFTQDDINHELVMYRLHKALDNTIRDNFQFRVAIPGDTSSVKTFSIKYTPSDSDVQFINNGLTDVQEGESKVITMEELFMKSISRDVYHFSILTSPEHGVLQLIDNKTGVPTDRNCTSFTTEDIRNGKVLYRHDDSENEDDSFSFLATPTITQRDVIMEIQEFTGIFEIKIQLRNDNKPERVINQVFTVVSGRGRVLTAEDILYSDKDVDFDQNEIIYMWKDIQNGELVQVEDKSAPVMQFKQKDLIDGKIYFKHRGANYGKAVLTVTDGFHAVKDVFEVRASEPYLMVSKNTGLSVVRGQSSPIKVNNLSISTNLDMEDKDVKFTVTSAPNHGALKKNGMEKSKFHLGDLRSGQLVYQHDGSMNLQDKFSFVVRAEELRQEAEVKVKIVLESHGNPPRLINSKMVMVDEKQMAYITSDELRVSHPETPDQEIIYTIDSHPQYGEIMLEDGLQGNDLKMFTQADVNARKLKYIHTRLGHTSDVMTFDVTNGIQPLQDLELVFEIIPKVIPMDVANIAVEEGANIPLTSDIIHITNKHFQRDELIFMVVKLPENGSIVSITSPEVPLGRFMWSQVNAEGIYYMHDGSDSVHDDFSLMAMSVSSEKKSNPRTIGVTIDPVNDQVPVVKRNRILDVWTGSMTPIGPENLRTADNDSAPYDLMYVITKPTNGDIVLASNPQQNIVNFTQAHINRGDVIFVHTGSEEGEFEYQVNDGANKAERKKFKIRAKQLILELKVNKPLEVYPGIIQPITINHLMAKTNDNNQTRPITYMMQAPLYGKFAVRRNNISVEVDTFTQQDIASGLIYYHHDGEMKGWIQNDTLEMEVSTAYAQSIRTQAFTVLISYENINENNRAQLIKVSKPMVDEGKEVTISREFLDITPLRRRLQNSVRGSTQVTYVITELPMHGVLVLNGENATVGDEMSQRDINRNNLHYMHDDSDSYWDTFKFSLTIVTSGGLQGSTSNGKHQQDNVFNITIVPVNDQKCVLLTENPEIRIIQEEVKSITTEALNTEDPDTPPEGISYNIIEGPTNGMVVYSDAPDSRVEVFTQKDVNSGRVLFIPNGGPESGAFYFTVTDGVFISQYKVFQIIVSRLTLELVNTSDIILMQGDVRQTLMPDNLNVETNGDKSKIVYNVTKPPVHGQLFMNNHPVYQFSQLNVEDKQVSYIQTDLSVYKDHFEFILYDTANMILEQRMNISVKARVISSTPDLPLGEDLVISTAMLNAGPLAELSASNPLYDIVEAPRFGKLFKTTVSRKKRRTRRTRKRRRKGKRDEEDEETRESDALRFTHQDIVDGRVAYKQNDDLNEPATDSFSYIVSTPTTQPAPGKFSISLVVNEDGAAVPEVKSPSPEVKDSKPIAKEVKPSPKSKPPVIDNNKEPPPDPTQKVGPDHIVILIIVCVITVIVIVGFIVGRCMRAARKRQELAAAKEDSRTPLSQQNPPVETQGPSDDPDGPSSPIPVINVTPDFADGDPEIDHEDDRSRSPSVAPSSSKSRSHSPHHFQPQSAPYPRDDYRVQGSSTPPPARSPKLVHSSPMSKSQDALKTEVSKTVPTCKVTPLFDGDNYGSLGRRTPGSGTLKRSGESNTGSLKRDQVTYDWDSVDPELLQHCRTTNPVLHDNKYWV